MNLNDIVNLISSTSVILVSIVGVWGIKKWRKEIRFKRKFELAEEILINAYEAVDVIGVIRFPASRTDEGQTRELKDDETPEQTRTLNNLYVIKERFLKNNDSFKKLFSIRYNVKAVMGKEFEENLNVILKMPKKIFNIVDQYVDVHLNSENYSNEERNRIGKEYSKTVFADLTRKEEDPIYMKMKVAIENLEKECVKILG